MVDLANLVATIAAAATGYFAFSPRVALGVGTGALLMTLNFFVLRRLTGFILTGTPKTMFAATGFLMLKLGLFFGAVWFCLTYLPISAIAFGIGAALVLLSVTIVTSHTSRETAEN